MRLELFSPTDRMNGIASNSVENLPKSCRIVMPGVPAGPLNCIFV